MANEIIFQKDAKAKITNVLIKDAVLFYCSIRRPKPIYDDRNKSYKDARKEYVVDLAVTEDVADAWDEVFTKQPSKKYNNKKFMEKYKLEDESELPFPKEKKQFTIQVKQKAENKEGDPIDPRSIPRVLMADPENPKKGIDITFDKNVGNGSTGHISARVMQNDYGSFVYLSKIRINDLNEYEDSSSGGLSEEEQDAFGFDEVEFAEADERQPVGKGGDDSDEEDEDDDIPFDDDDDDY